MKLLDFLAVRLISKDTASAVKVYNALYSQPRVVYKPQPQPKPVVKVVEKMVYVPAPKPFEPKTSPNFRNANGFYCYFGTKNGAPEVLRIVHQYYADDWLFIRKYKFSIDGNAYSYTPIDVKTDNGDGGMVWEWSDEAVDSEAKDVLNALINSKSAKIRLEGRQYYDTKSITSTQIKSIKETIELYRLMGGEY